MLGAAILGTSYIDPLYTEETPGDLQASQNYIFPNIDIKFKISKKKISKNYHDMAYHG
jgi:hypothetical protein